MASIVLLTCSTALGHTDLQEQIDELTRRLDDNPGNTELLLRRGDLHRRHRDWPKAAADFSTVHKMQPDNPMLDWFEGRMRVDAGDYTAGREQLGRFIATHPGHTGALQARARAHWALGNPDQAARDYQQAIKHAERPSPGLYRALVVTLAFMGPSEYRAAQATVDQALESFPLEMTLLGLGVELAILNEDRDGARAYLERVPGPVLELGQWQYRLALADCVAGKLEAEGHRFARLLESEQSNNRPGTWHAPMGTMTLLARYPLPGTCRAAAMQSLAAYTP